MTQPELKKGPPTGCSRALWRAPIFLYRVGLGGLLGDRFLLLEHTGRVSGKTRQAVIEVVRHDRLADVFIVAAGFGEKSDWYQNLMKTPVAVIKLGKRRYAMRARRLPPEEAEAEMLDYARRHPTALRGLSWMLDYPLEPSEEGIRKLGRLLPIIEFKPTHSANR